MIRTDVSVPITLALKQAGRCITDEELPLKPTKAEADCIFFFFFSTQYTLGYSVLYN